MDSDKNQQKHIVYLGMGTNAGDRFANLQAAVVRLSPQLDVREVSRVYQTPPWGYTDQADFLNLVAKAETTLTPKELLDFLKDLEAKIGRTATFRWGPREIDIDILFYNDRILKGQEITIPHPRLHERAFVLIPLSELNRDLVHPVLNQTVAKMLEGVDHKGVSVYPQQLALEQESENK